MRVVWLSGPAIPATICARQPAAVDNLRQPREIARGHPLKRITNIGAFATKEI
jgi:hypothetical protein